MSDAPFLRLRAVSRRYRVGGQDVNALRAIDLDIASGEMIALVGASGSGKSTLMNILGCLDRPNSGIYSVAGRDTSKLDPDETAALRCAYFGFVFQRYHLLSQLTARDNVEIPAVYAGAGAAERHARATELLTRLGLGERLDHLPNELSGGQQQRVSIARALMNGGAVILADEPTGALDSATGEEMMKILLALNAQGHTLIIATHDHRVAAHAKRIIEMADGVIVGDRAIAHEAGPASPEPAISTIRPSPWIRYLDAARMAFLSLRAHRLRTALTALGVIIGVFAVVMTVALGDNAQRFLEKSLEAVGAKQFEIEPGQQYGDPRAERLQTLTVQDLDALRRQYYVRSASPRQTTSSLLRYGSSSGLATIWGVGESYFDVKSLAIVAGVAFDAEDVARQAQVIVIDENVQRQFFGSESPLGKTVYIGNLPCMIIGVVGHVEGRLQQSSDSKLNVWVPFTVVSTRLTGRQHLQNIFLRLRADQSTEIAERRMTDLLSERHRTKDFVVWNLDEVSKTTENLVLVMSLVFATIGAISLVVGGVGVMNIMLVSAAERAKEIGIRIAVGARRADIRDQFLTEAIAACLLGAAGGVAISVAIGFVLAWLSPKGFEFALSGRAVAIAVGCAALTGVVAGYAPARKAARLDPVEALARD
ncbi:MacB family efflux pump subunit [Methylosinus sp. LW4]|uniref:MacB family efflux pump subunit n=1 Tax=Methylosinus sp. LW4 TaxID=136993 RepID=UPI000362F1CF|nr:MacB family efflux pump subunit [Methylosinus sp. LW4]